MSYWNECKLGEKVKSAAAERLKLKENASEVIGVPSNRIFDIRTHYLKGVGNFHCFGGECCKLLGIAKQYVIIPVITYTGEPSRYGQPVFWKYLQVGTKAYNVDIKTKVDIKKDLTKFDLLVTCKDGQYQNFSYDVLEQSLWRQDEEIKNFVKQGYKDFVGLIQMSAARELNEEMLHTLLNQQNNQQNNQPQNNQRPMRQANPQRQMTSHQSQIPEQIDAVEIDKDVDVDDLLQ